MFDQQKGSLSTLVSTQTQNAWPMSIFCTACRTNRWGTAARDRDPERGRFGSGCGQLPKLNLGAGTTDVMPPGTVPTTEDNFVSRQNRINTKPYQDSCLNTLFDRFGDPMKNLAQRPEHHVKQTGQRSQPTWGPW